MTRFFVILYLLLIISSLGSAQYYDGDHGLDIRESTTANNQNGEITYGDYVDIEAWCDPDTGTCSGAGGGSSTREFKVIHSEDNTRCGNNGAQITLESRTSANTVYNYSGVKQSSIPGELHCGLGTYKLQLIDDTTGSDVVLAEQQFEVRPFSMSDPNKGDYIVVRMDHYTGDELNDFFLTNTPWEDSDGPISNTFVEDNDANPVVPEGAHFLFANHIRDAVSYNYLDTGVLSGSYGDVVGTSERFGSYLNSDNTFLEPDEGWYAVNKQNPDGSSVGEDMIWDVANKQFGSGMNMKLGRTTGCKLARPTGGEYSASECAPLHKTGEYRPEGEIITATDMSRAQDNFYEVLTDRSMAKESKTNFYVCRGDYRGTDIDSSEVVKVQQGLPADPEGASWEYYRCNMDNEWVQDLCPPGQEIRYDQDQGEVDCENLEDINIQATFFNVTNISFNSQSYTTGFKINRSELDKYQDIIGDPATVDAECWIGEDNQRPANPDGSVVFSAQDPGTGDLWMLEKLPARSNADNSTYSCLWGLRNTGGDSTMNIFDTSNNDPVNSMDGGRMDIKFTDLQDKTTLTSTNKLARWVWDLYEKPEDGGYDSREIVNDQAHFMFDEEFPYCRGTSFWTPPLSNRTLVDGDPEQLQNIVCSGGIGSDVDTYPDYANPPNADISGPSEVESGETADYSGSGSNDPDGTIESYEWEVVDGGGSTVTSGTGQDFSFTPGSTGTYTVELNVRDDIGAVGTSTLTLDVTTNPVGSEDQFEVAYIAAHYSSQSKFEEDASYSWNVLQDALPADPSKTDMTTVPLDTCNMDCVIRDEDGDDTGPECWSEIEDKKQCVGSGEPLSADDANKFMVLCDDDSGNCGTDTGVTGVASTPGIGSSTRWRSGVDPDNAMTASHEVGHTLGLQHVFTEAMLESGYEFGDTYDPDSVDPTIGECWFPGKYEEDAGGGLKRIVDYEYTPFPNSDDKYKGEESKDYFMTYCDDQNRFGPNAENYMQSGPLSDYQ